MSVCKGSASLLFALFLFGGCRAPSGAPWRGTNTLPGGTPAPAAPATPARGAAVRELSALVVQVRRSVVSVVAGRAAPGERVERKSAREHALGSGFLIAADGLVLTSRHVIDGADDVRVELDDRRTFTGAVVARDATLDVAIIRLQGAAGLPVAALGSSGGVRVGDAVIAIGNPFGLGPSVTMGILSAAARGIEEGPPGRFLQTDAAVNPGDSGGPLLDGAGRVIGINTAVVEHGHGISFAVPIDEVRAVLPELEATGRVARGRAGITFQEVDAALARALGLSDPAGAIVTEIDVPGPAERAGVRPGDLITMLDGHPIERAQDLSSELDQRKPGVALRLSLRRGGCRHTLSVLLDRLPNPDGDAEPQAAPHARSRDVAGIHLVDDEGGGARVEALDPASTAADGLRLGDVVVEIDRTPVHTAVDAVRRLVQDPRPITPPAAMSRPVRPGSHSVLVRVRRDGSFLYVGIDLDR